MDSAAVKAFDRALLDLDAALRPVIDRPHATGRAAAARDAHRRFLGTVAPLRMELAIAEHLAAAGRPLAEGQDRALVLLGRCLSLAEQSGVSRTDIVALVNRETVEQAH